VSWQSLEVLVERIHTLLEPTAKVTWNARIRDPDTQQLRQVDVLVERDGQLTHIECRDYKEPQDVKWVEELIGRRESLRVDSVIAVSRSGFTKPAVIKASAKGIFLRQLSELSDQEVLDWGKLSRVVIDYVKLNRVTVTLYVDDMRLSRAVNLDALVDPNVQGHPGFELVRTLLQAKQDDLLPLKGFRLKGTITPRGLTVDGIAVERAGVDLEGQLVHHETKVAGVSTYCSPQGADCEQEVMVETRDEGFTQIIQHNDRVSMIFDLSRIRPPANHYFRTCMIDSGRPVRAQVRVIGKDVLFSGPLDVEINLAPISHA
jgi:hypothetical protein